MTSLAQRIESSVAEAMPSMQDATKKLRVEQNRMRCIPQGDGEVGELAAIRKLLRLDRPSEALIRLEVLLDRKHGDWRTLA